MNEFKQFLEKKSIKPSKPENPVTEIQIHTPIETLKKRSRWHWISDSVVQKEDKSIKFFADAKKNIKYIKQLLPYDLLYKLYNPLKLQGVVEVYHITNYDSEIALTASFTSDKIYIEKELIRDSDKLWIMDIKDIDISIDLLKHGFLRNMFTYALPTWDKLGIALVTSYITNGFYASTTAKLGFDFGDERDLKKIKKHFHRYLKIKGVTIRSKLAYSWDIVNVVTPGYEGEFGEEIGKEFLINYTLKINRRIKETNGWIGVLDLEKCSSSRLQLEKYIFNKVLPKSVKCIQGKTEKKLYKTMSPERQLHMMVRHKISQHICAGNSFLKRGMIKEAEEQFKITHTNINTLTRQRKWKDYSLSQFLHTEIKNALKEMPSQYK